MYIYTKRSQLLDMITNQKMLKLLLNTKSILCDVADNGQIAVEIISQDVSKYNIVFMDYTMPVMSGCEAVRLLRSIGFTNLIIGVTGNVLNDDIKAFYDSGVDIVYRKPFKMADLMYILEYIQNNGFKSSGRMFISD